MPELIITREELKRHKRYFDQHARENLKQLKGEVKAELEIDRECGGRI